MTRRRLVVLVSAAVLLTLGIATFVLLFVATRTEYGHEQLRKRVIEPLIAGAVQGGTVHLGRIGGNFLDSVTIDSIAIREKSGELFVSTGRVIVKFDPRDIWDRRVYLRRVDVEHPYLHFVQRPTGRWNYSEVFARGGDSAQRKPASDRGWGHYFVIDSARTRDGSFVLTMPWHVDTSLHGAARDSAVRYNLARDDHVIRRSGIGFTRTYTWRHATGLIAHARLADPDSNRVAGREFAIAALDVDEVDPPFAFRRMSGTVRQLGDSVWFQVPHFDLPASTGVASGKIVWGSNLPMRYDIAVRGDSVALNDVNWVYPTLPRTGGGSMMLNIRNDPKNLSIIDYKLTKLDVHSTKSHLTGAMSFGTGLPLLLVRDVDLKADPVDFDLIRTLNGKPFPVDWRGRVVGTVKARGGLLTNFFVDDARGVFHDDHGPGATTRFSGRGELDILEPAYTAFHGFEATVSPLDLRTIEFLYPSFPRLNGFISGSATLDSSWLDVRFSNADVTHQDGPGEPSRFTGSGRVTYGEKFMIYDVALNAEPLSLTMLARSPEFKTLPFRGLVSGPIRAKGTMPDLELALSLKGSGGALSFEGRADADSVGGYGAHGSGQFSGLDVRDLLGRASLPNGSFSGHYTVDLAGPTLGDIRGKADLSLERSVFDGIRLQPSSATLRFANGRMYVDSLALRTAAGLATARGAIGLPGGASDSLRVFVHVDSLGGLRRYLGLRDSARIARIVDSLSGRFSIETTLRGRVDSLDVAGRVTTAEKVFVRGLTAAGVADFSFRNLGSTLASPNGSFKLQADSVMLGGISFDSLGATIDLSDRTHGSFVAGASRRKGPRVSAAGTLGVEGSAQSLRLDSLRMDVGEAHWRLAQPARLTLDSTRGLYLDSFVFRNGDSAVVTVNGEIPNEGSVRGKARATHVPLHDIAQLAKYARSVSGLADFDVDLTGTKANPVIAANAALSGVKAGDVSVERTTAAARYEAKRWVANANVFMKGDTAVKASASGAMDLTLFTAHIPNDSIRFKLSADSADFGIIQTFLAPSIDGTRGRLTARLEGNGVWNESYASLNPTGTLTVEAGRTTVKSLGIELQDITVRATLAKNKFVIDTLSLTSRSLASKEARPGNLLWASGSVDNALDSLRRTFDLTLRARDFHPIDRRTKAKLDVTIPQPGLRLTGAPGNVALTGSVIVNRGQVFLPDPEIARKQLLDIDADTVVNFGGGSASMDAMLARLGFRSAQVNVTLGEDVKLKSSEADVKLSGSVLVSMQKTTSSLGGRGTTSYPVTVDGAFLANSGTYTLDLGLARRDFTVMRGLVSFDATTNPPNPDIDISAIYRVKRAQKEDIGVIVNVKGPLKPGPKIDFTSDQTYDISQSDLLSYLITNEPGFDFTTGRGAQALAFIAPTFSSITASALRDRTGLGSLLDVVQFQGAAPTSIAQQGKSSGLDFLYGATLGGEKQVGSNLFFSLNAGLCPFKADQGLSPLDALGGSFEYRINPRLSLNASVEQGTLARYCTSGSSLTSLAPTPRQLSFGLRKTWRF
jgi:translocation and assembly module TamB